MLYSDVMMRSCLNLLYNVPSVQYLSGFAACDLIAYAIFQIFKPGRNTVSALKFLQRLPKLLAWFLVVFFSALEKKNRTSVNFYIHLFDEILCFLGTVSALKFLQRLPKLLAWFLVVFFLALEKKNRTSVNFYIHLFDEILCFLGTVSVTIKKIIFRNQRGAKFYELLSNSLK